MIKIINGVFGYNNGKSIIPKTSKDEPFECDKAVEKRLVALGVAKYVTKAEAGNNEPQELDKEALIKRYKELKLGGNPATWKAETIAKKIAEAEAKLADTDTDTDTDSDTDADTDAPTFEEDGVVD